MFLGDGRRAISWSFLLAFGHSSTAIFRSLSPRLKSRRAAQLAHAHRREDRPSRTFSPFDCMPVPLGQAECEFLDGENRFMLCNPAQELRWSPRPDHFFAGIGPVPGPTPCVRKCRLRRSTPAGIPRATRCYVGHSQRPISPTPRSAGLRRPTQLSQAHLRLS